MYVVFSLLDSIRHLQFVQVATEMSSDVVDKPWEDIINVQLFELMHSQIVSEAFGGLLAIGVFRSFIP